MNLHRVVESAAFSQRTVDLTLHQSAGADLHERLLQSLEYAWSALAHMVCLEPNDHFQVADYREQLNSDKAWALWEGGMFFEGTNKVHVSLQRKTSSAWGRCCLPC